MYAVFHDLLSPVPISAMVAATHSPRGMAHFGSHLLEFTELSSSRPVYR